MTAFGIIANKNAALATTTSIGGTSLLSSSSGTSTSAPAPQPAPVPQPAPQPAPAPATATVPAPASLSSSLGFERNEILTPLATLELQYFKVVSLYRQRNYEKCIEVCNAMLQAGHESNVQMFTTSPDDEDGNADDDSSSLTSTVASASATGTATSTLISAAAILDSSSSSPLGVAGPGAVYNAGTFTNIGGSNSAGADASGGGGNIISNISYGGVGSSIGGKNNNSSNNRYNSSNLQRIASRQNERRYPGVGSNNNNNYNKELTTTIAQHMPSWMMEGVWQLKMRALTQRIYVDDLETNDEADEGVQELEFERIATAARPRTSIKTAFIPRPNTTRRAATSSRPNSAKSSFIHGLRSSDGPRISTGISSRPTSGMARPSTSLSRPGSSLSTRPASRCGTASRVRATSAAAFNIGDTTNKLYQASRLNPTIYAERPVLIKALFQFLFYHEADVQKAYSLCEAVIDLSKYQRNSFSSSALALASSTSNASSAGTSVSSAGAPASGRHKENHIDWWWDQQMGRCLLALHYPQRAEHFLLKSLSLFPHPDTFLLLSRLYQRLKQPEKALQLISTAIDRHPFDVIFRIEQGRIYDAMSKTDEAMQIYRLISKLNPINTEALACIALNYFYENNPEMALMYYKRILSLGIHSPELYCNIALCCLYGGQIDLVLPCFQRALITAKTSDQKADIWYNLSFVAITTGDFQLARRCLKLCLTADGRNGAALNNLAVLAAQSGDILKAKSYLNAAKEVLSDSNEIVSNLKYMEIHYKL